MTAPLSQTESMTDEIAALVEVLQQTEQRLEELTGGEVDTVADRQGRTFILRRAQEALRHAEASRQAAILNALPAYIALLDVQGAVVSVNEAWRGYVGPSAPQNPGHAKGCNYLVLCEDSQVDGAFVARKVAQGIRSVLAGTARVFSIDYSCDSATEHRSLMLTVTPLSGDRPNGVVVMHVDVTAEKLAEDKLRRLNRVHAVLSGINSVIVRVGDRNDLFSEVCRIAVEAGAFKMAWIGTLDPSTLDGRVVNRFGGEDAYVDGIRLTGRDGTPDSESPACRALRLLQPVICNDIATDFCLAERPDQLLSRGHRSSAFFPLTVEGRPAALIALFAGEANFFDGEEMRLLLELVGNVSFALDHMEKSERLNYVGYYDLLTGLANRRLFLERVTQYIKAASSGGHKLAIYVFDLERFKNINDTFGWLAGDALLRQTTDWLIGNLGDASLIARVGADQFAAVLPEVTQEEAVARLLENSLKAFLEHPFQLNDSIFRVAAKVGVALFPDDGTDADTVFRNAEAALKKAKIGGDRYLFYAQKMTETVAGRLVLDYQLRHALENDQFVLHYQPMVSLASGRLTGAEALIRWHDPQMGLVQPGRFIPILEETGLIFEVGRWVLRQAVKQHLSWRAASLPLVRISVNVSPLQLRNRAFLADIEEAIGSDTGAAAGLELGITESLIMEDIKHTIGTLRAIRAMGVSIAIDDFGTGFSSLSYLAKLPTDTLKIDRSFVTDMKAGPQGIALVSTIINLGHSLKLKVVAEGVETNEQAGVLRELNCDEMQGFLLSMPVSSSCFETRFLSHLGPSDEFIAPCVVRHRRHPVSRPLPSPRNAHGQ
jgi:diguanylate cyclase (GGDEF)-like protein